MHQAEISKTERQELRSEESKALAAALRRELIAAFDFMGGRIQVFKIPEAAYLAFKDKTQVTTNTKEILPFSAPIFESSIARLNLLSASLIGDIAKVYGRLRTSYPPMENLNAAVLAAFYKGLAVGAQQLSDDVFHVAMRLRAYEWGEADPGTLLDRDKKKKASEEQKPPTSESPPMSK